MRPSMPIAIFTLAYEVVDRDAGSRVGFGRFAHIWTHTDGGERRPDRDLWQKRSEPVAP
jgi:hypothetical protein